MRRNRLASDDSLPTIELEDFKTKMLILIPKHFTNFLTESWQPGQGGRNAQGAESQGGVERFQEFRK